jgi:hypothetical protein
MGLMQGFQAFSRHMGVNLRGGQIAVAQQHLHHAQIGSVINQMGGEGVT